MPHKIEAHCISLRRSPRREKFTALARKVGLDFVFIDAVSPDDLIRGGVLDGVRIDVTDMRWIAHERHDPRRQKGPLLFTEIGCAYSHILCWQRARERDLDFVIVFEDDAVLLRPLTDLKIPADADLFYIHERMPRNGKGEAQGYGAGAYGYILSRAGIEKCLRIFEILYMPLDVQIMAHQRSQIAFGHGITRYRRDLPEASLLNAYVSAEPYCDHPRDGETSIR